MKLQYGRTFLLGFGFFGVSVIWGIYNAFVPLYLGNKFGLAPAWIGIFMTLDNVAAMLIQPPVGAWSDRLRTRIGRRMPFILIGAPIGALAFGLIPLAAILPLFVACTSTLLLSMAFWRTPVVALMPDITPSKYRSQANGIITFMGGMGAIIAFLGGSYLYKLNPAYPFWFGSGLVVLSTILLFFFIREPKEYKENDKQPGIIESLKSVMVDPDKSALRMFGAIFFWFIGYSAIEAFFSLYAYNHLHLEEAEGVRIMGLPSLIYVGIAIPAGYIGARIGRRGTIIIGLLLVITSAMIIYLLSPAVLIAELIKLPVLGVVNVVGAILMLTGAGWAFIGTNSLPMVVDMTKDTRIGTYIGLYYLFFTFAAVIGPNLNGWIIQLSGSNYNTIMIVAPVMMLAALGSMLGVRRGEVR